MMLHKFYFIAFLFLLSCNHKPKNADRNLSEDEKAAISNITTISNQEGLSMLKVNCYACHNPSSESHDNMLAPPLAGIKYKYKSMYPDEEMFVAQMSDFLIHPTKENALMKGPVRRFGLMPVTTLSKSEAQKLVKYIYHNEMEVPAWFPEHFEEEHGTPWKASH